ncbi:MAG: response regulator [Ferruginibacter sp.]
MQRRNMPIIYIEDDEDDRRIFSDIIKESTIDYPLRCFETGMAFLNYLQTTIDEPLLIFCDINLPMLSGIDLRIRMLSEDELNKKNIPFVFFSTGPIPTQITSVKDLNVQGHFLKTHNIHKLSSSIRMIIRYWSECLLYGNRIKADEFLL